jgi:hypothetical protein
VRGAAGGAHQVSMLTRAVLVYAQVGMVVGDWEPCQRMRSVRSVLLGCNGLGVDPDVGVVRELPTTWEPSAQLYLSVMWSLLVPGCWRPSGLAISQL